MALNLKVGMSWGKVWLGLPFRFAALLFVLVSVIVLSVKL